MACFPRIEKGTPDSGGREGGPKDWGSQVTKLARSRLAPVSSHARALINKQIIMIVIILLLLLIIIIVMIIVMVIKSFARIRVPGIRFNAEELWQQAASSAASPRKSVTLSVNDTYDIHTIHKTHSYA